MKSTQSFLNKNSNIQSVKLQFLYEFYMIVLFDSFVYCSYCNLLPARVAGSLVMVT